MKSPQKEESECCFWLSIFENERKRKSERAGAFFWDLFFYLFLLFFFVLFILRIFVDEHYDHQSKNQSLGCRN